MRRERFVSTQPRRERCPKCGVPTLVGLVDGVEERVGSLGRVFVVDLGGRLRAHEGYVAHPCAAGGAR